MAYRGLHDMSESPRGVDIVDTAPLQCENGQELQIAGKHVTQFVHDMPLAQRRFGPVKLLERVLQGKRAGSRPLPRKPKAPNHKPLNPPTCKSREAAAPRICDRGERRAYRG